MKVKEMIKAFHHSFVLQFMEKALSEVASLFLILIPSPS